MRLSGLHVISQTTCPCRDDGTDDGRASEEDVESESLDVDEEPPLSDTEEVLSSLDKEEEWPSVGMVWARPSCRQKLEP